MVAMGGMLGTDPRHLGMRDTATKDYAKTITLGKINYYNPSGRKINLVEIEIEIKDGRLSMVGIIWNGNHTGLAAAGQMHDEIGRLFRRREVWRMVKIWKRWHLNDARAGDPVQEAWLREHPETPTEYTARCKALADAGLLVHDGYKYGSAWLTEELPDEVRAEIESWD